MINNEDINKEELKQFIAREVANLKDVQSLSDEWLKDFLLGIVCGVMALYYKRY